MLGFLSLLVPLALWIARGASRRTSDWASLGQLSRPRREGAWWWFAAAACLVVALAQPRWGRGDRPPLPPGHDLVLVVDDSRSMGAQDAFPNRLEVAVQTATSLLKALGREPGSRAAVVAFAGRARLRCPMTENLGAAEEALRKLRPGSVRPGGTDLGAALDAALEAFDEQDHTEGRTVVLFSDGEDLAGSWPSKIERIRAAGVVVHSVAVGDRTKASPIPIGRGAETLKYLGKPVLSKADDRVFKGLADATGGVVLPVGLAPADLSGLFRTRIAPVARRAHELLRPSEQTERFSVFVFSALLFGLGGSWLSLRRRYGRGFWAFAVALAALGAAEASDSASAEVTKGREAYAAGRIDQALAAFERAISLDPSSAVARYNAGAALFRLERYLDAMIRYQEARELAPAALRTKIDFALGNTAIALGDVPAALAHYDACIESTARGRVLDVVRQDAAANRAFAEEHAQQPSTPPNPSGETPPPPKRNHGSNPSGDDDGNEDGPSPPNDGDRESDQPGGVSSKSRRGPGGAGGGGTSAPRAGASEERLAAALENIKDARGRRLEDEAPPPDENQKDW
jgi:Ca-activated chloride channel family protein